MAYRRLLSRCLRDLPCPLCGPLCLQVVSFFRSVPFKSRSTGACLSPRGKVRYSGRAVRSRMVRGYSRRLRRLLVVRYWENRSAKLPWCFLSVLTLTRSSA